MYQIKYLQLLALIFACTLICGSLSAQAPFNFSANTTNGCGPLVVSFYTDTVHYNSFHWDFGDGSERVEVRSDGNVKKLDPNGYAVTAHTFESAGEYLVRVERTNDHGVSAIGRLHVHVE